LKEEAAIFLSDVNDSDDVLKIFHKVILTNQRKVLKLRRN